MSKQYCEVEGISKRLHHPIEQRYIWGLFLLSSENFSERPFAKLSLFSKAGLFICCQDNKNKNNCKVSCLETPSF